MGFNLSDYVTGAESIEPSSFAGPEDGHYEFEVTNIYLKQGSQNNPDTSWIFVEYQLENGQKYNELFTLPKNPDRPTDNERQTLGRYLSRLMDLGVPRAEVNTVDTDTIVGRTGTLQLVTTTNRKTGKEYQNIRKVTLTQPGDQPTLAQVGVAQAATARPNPFSGV